MIKDHKILIEQESFQQTPNVSRDGVFFQPKYLIIHYSASGSMASTVKTLCSPKEQRSAHIVIGRDGKIVQLAKFNQRAWHAGISEWNGESSLNRLSFGIELVNWGKLERDKDGKAVSWAGTEIPEDEVTTAMHKNDLLPALWHKYTPEQIASCKQVASEIFREYNLKDVLGHDDISPGRKSDPGPLFPMDEVRAYCFQESLNYKLG